MNPMQVQTTPYGLPWGYGIPKNAKKNHRDLENAMMNSQTMFLWQMRLYELAMSVFEWENLPEGINERQIEWWLLRDGFCVFLHDEDIALHHLSVPRDFIYGRQHCTTIWLNSWCALYGQSR